MTYQGDWFSLLIISINKAPKWVSSTRSEKQKQKSKCVLKQNIKHKHTLSDSESTKFPRFYVTESLEGTPLLKLFYFLIEKTNKPKAIKKKKTNN